VETAPVSTEKNHEARKALNNALTTFNEQNAQFAGEMDALTSIRRIP